MRTRKKIRPPSNHSWTETELERQLFGAFYLFPELGFYRISAAPTGLPHEYFSPQKKITIAPDRITDFLQAYGEILRSEPAIIVDESLLDRETLASYEAMAVNHESLSSENVTIEIDYKYENFSISMEEILEAKALNRRFIVRGNKWVDIPRPEFAWLDGLDKREIKAGRVNLSRSEYLRFLALNDRIEKKYLLSENSGIGGKPGGPQTPVQSPINLIHEREIKIISEERIWMAVVFVSK